MKKISIALLAALGLLGMNAVTAAPKVSIKASVPKGTAGDEKAVAGKGMPWLPCTSGAVTLGGLATTITADKLQFDLDVTNADDDKDTAKNMDYDLYVIFANYSGTGTAYYMLTPNPAVGGPTLTLLTNDAAWLAATPSTYRYMSKSDFGTTAALKATVFGTAISLDTASLPQGLWSAMAIMTRPNAVADAGGTLPSPDVVKAAVDPATTAGSTAIHDPRNWAAWSMQAFILGTPFKTATGVAADATATGAGTCL